MDITLAGKGTGAVIVGQATSTGVKLAADQAILDSSGNELVKFVKTATAVNEVTITNQSTGVGPSIAATGETNVPLTIAAKGTGTLTLGQATGKVQVGTAATDYVGLYDATPVVRANHVTDAAVQVLDGSDTVDKTKLTADILSCKTAINAILVALENLGVLKTS